MKTLYHIPSLTLSRKVSLAFIIGTGFLPVTSIALHCIGLMPLNICLFALIIPAVTSTVLICLQNSHLRKAIMYGWLAGIIAVFCYYLTRIPYMFFGWGDFIPRIGGWIQNSNETNAVL